MKIWKKPWFIPIVLTVLILIAGQLYTAGKLTKANTLTEEEIDTQLSMIYQGEVDDLELQGSVYTAKVVKGSSEYAVEVDAETGKVLSLVQTKEATGTDVVMSKQPDEENSDATGETSKKPEELVTEKAPEKVDSPPVSEDKNNTGTSSSSSSKSDTGKSTAQSKPTDKPATPPKKSVLISEQQAAKIGLAQLPAGVVGEVDDVDFEESAGGGYYLVQIDIDTDDDLDEVTYQVHAITGKVLTVSWDD